MKRLILLLSSVFLIGTSTYACGGLTQQAQGGELHYDFDSIDPLVCTLTATLYFDINEPLSTDSIYVSWGDGNLQYVFGISISVDTAVPAGLNTAPVFQHVYQATHRYSATGSYYPTVLLQYRPSFISNISNGQTNNLTFYIEALVMPGATGNEYNRGTIITGPFNLFGYVNDTFSYTPTYVDPDGDSIVFSAIAPLEDHNTAVPEYVFPDSFCNYYFEGTSGYSVDPHTGKILWTSTCYEGLYTIAFMVSKYRKGELIGSIIRDQNLYIVNAPTTSATGISSVPEDETAVKIFPDPVENTLSGTITGLNSAVAIAGIYTMDGRLVVSQVPLSNGNFQLDVTVLPAGMYLFQTTVNGRSITQKFVKETEQ